MRLLACLAFLITLLGCDPAPTTPEDGGTGRVDAPHDGAVPVLDGAGRDGGASDDDGGARTDAGMLPPTVTSACDTNGVCSGSETCASCGADCGSCDVEALADQNALYVDLACAVGGDGTTDVCATSAGGAGRFRDLTIALDALEAGDTLYVHPGDYWRDAPDAGDSGAAFEVRGTGTADRPIVVTARFRERPPTIHSCDPTSLDDCPSAALAGFGVHVILDHLRIRGRVQLWGGSDQTMQWLECTRGWGAGDGNDSCLRIDSCTNCRAHHNFVHDLEGGLEDAPRRTCALKEFDSDGAIWELNTVLDAPYSAYDLHRNSENATLRFNFFAGWHRAAIRVERTHDVLVYGNVMVGATDVAERCVDVILRNEEVMTAPHVVELHHDTCVGAGAGFDVRDDMLEVHFHDSVLSGLVSFGETPRNVAFFDATSEVDHNAYDDTARWVGPGEAEIGDLAAWRAATGWDGASIAGEGGACELVGGPSTDPTSYRVAAGSCRTLARDGGEVGAFGITTCVGHLCP